MYQIRILLLAFLLIPCLSNACVSTALFSKCARITKQKIDSNGIQITNRSIDFLYETSNASIGDDDVWVKLGNPMVFAGPFRLKFLWSTPMPGGGSCYNGYYSLLISERILSNGNWVLNPDWPQFSGFLTEDGELNCDHAFANFKTYYSVHVPNAQNFPNTAPGMVCCPSIEDPEGLQDSAIACIGLGQDGRKFLKITLPAIFANMYDSTQNSCSVPALATSAQLTMYAYLRVNGVWSLAGLLPYCRYQQMPGNPQSAWDYFYYLPDSLTSDCYDVMALPKPTSFGFAIPESIVQKACNCCNANFSYTVSTNMLAVGLQAFASGVNYHWNFSDGTTSNGNWFSKIFPPSLLGYSVTLSVTEGATIKSRCRKHVIICFNDQGKESQSALPPFCDANFTYTANTFDNSVMFSANNPNQVGPYIWSLGNGMTVSGKTAFSYKYQSGGSYNVCLTVGSPGKSCTVCADLCQIGNSSGIDDGSDIPRNLHRSITHSQTNEPSIYPNPIGNEFTVQWQANEGDKTIIILKDILGRTILTQSVASQAGMNQLKIPSENLPSGVYVCDIRISDSGYRIRVIK